MSTDWASTRRLGVRITLAEGMMIVGDVHLQPRVAWREGPETVLELLNREDNFFIVSLPGGDVAFVAKEQVAMVAYRVPTDEDAVRHNAARTINLEVMLVGGGEYRGVVECELPPTRSRPIDFLNLPERFFELTTPDASLCLNRRLVRAARPL